MWTTAGRRASATLTTTREKASSASPSSGGGGCGCGSGGVLEPLLMKCCQNRDMEAPCQGVSADACILAARVKPSALVASAVARDASRKLWQDLSRDSRGI